MLNTKDLTNVTFDAVATLEQDFLASFAYAVLWSYHITAQENPGQLLFGQNMLLNINLQLNYRDMFLRKQKLVNNNNNHESTTQVQYDYEVGH